MRKRRCVLSKHLFFRKIPCCVTSAGANSYGKFRLTWITLGCFGAPSKNRGLLSITITRAPDGFPGRWGAARGVFCFKAGLFQSGAARNVSCFYPLQNPILYCLNPKEGRDGLGSRGTKNLPARNTSLQPLGHTVVCTSANSRSRRAETKNRHRGKKGPLKWAPGIAIGTKKG